MLQAIKNLIPAMVLIAIAILLAAAFLARLRRVQRTATALVQTQVKAMDRQSDALERIAAALEAMKQTAPPQSG
jgi:uncharacterized membrane protein affecting hemolysin expression